MDSGKLRYLAHSTLVGASKLKGCDGIKDWIKEVRRHIYWCATFPKAGFQSLIVAKWKSLIRHISNKHSNHPDQLCKQCNHGVLEPRKLITVGKNCCVNPKSCYWGGTTPKNLFEATLVYFKFYMEGNFVSIIVTRTYGI